MHEQSPVEHDGEEQVGQWAGDHDGHALQYRLPVEGWSSRLGATALAFVEHLDVAAQWNGRQGPFGAVLAGALGDDLAEADREAQHLDAAPAGHDNGRIRG
jgi:hypothetical protein